MNFTLQAQISDQIKKPLFQLIKKADKSSDKEMIKSKIENFISKAPNERAKKGALSFIKNNTTSLIVKEIIDELNNTKVKRKISKQKAFYKLLKNAMIIDMLSEKPKKGSLLIKDDKIEKISYNDDFQTPEETEIINLNGKYVIPGLIDGHVHITHGTFEDAKHHLKEAVLNGVTGVRDMGGDGRILTLLKRNTLIGEDIGSDVYFSTIIAGPEFFQHDKRPQSVAKGAVAGNVSWQRAITHKTDLRQVVSEVKGLGATAIKVYLNVDKVLFKKIADEAKRQGIKVWAHAAVPPTKAIDITNGGALAMSHAGDMIPYEFIEGDLKSRHEFKNREEALAYRKKLKNVQWNKNSPEVKRLFTAMKTNNSILDATLHVYNRKGRAEDLKNALKAVRIAHEYGVKIGAGSDNMITQKKNSKPILNIHGEMKLLTKAGLSNFNALKAATVINAEIVGESKNIGTLEKGKIANIVVLNANPLIDISNTQEIDFVIKRGKILK